MNICNRRRRRCHSHENLPHAKQFVWHCVSLQYIEVDRSAFNVTSSSSSVNYFYIKIFCVRELYYIKMAMSPSTKQKVAVIIEVTKTVFHWGFVPTILYLGWFLFHFLSFFQLNTFTIVEFIGFRRGADPGSPPLTLLR